jgi:hypothetical protein
MFCAALRQGRGQVAVDFAGQHFGAGGQQLVGQGPEAGPDLHDPLAGRQFGSGEDLRDHVGSAQEILAEAFTGTMGERRDVVQGARLKGLQSW